MTHASAFLCLLLALPAQPPAKRADPPPVIFPDAPQPPPAPAPGPTPLPADSLYVVRSSVACTVVASPDGLLKVTAQPTPATVRAKFVGGSGGYETRKFDDKFLYLVAAVGAGQCELIVVTIGDSGPVLYRRSIAAGGVPPPGPVPPGPPPADPLTKVFQSAYDQDQDRDRAKSLEFLQGVYAGMPDLVPGWGIATDADLYAKIKQVVQDPKQGLTPTQVVKLRTAIAAELLSAFGPSASANPLTPQAAAAELSKIGKALGGVK